jgi:hypothetical protein
MVFVVGIALVVKRGWRIALFHTLAPAIAFSVWFIAIGRSNHVAGNPARLRPLPQAVHFASLLITGTYESLTRTSAIGGLLVLLLVAAVVVVVRRSGAQRRKDAVIPCAMLVGSVFFAVETGLGRADLLKQGAQAVRGGHYMDVVAYLTLPAVALVADALVRRWRFVAAALVALMVVVVPLNVRALDAHARSAERGLVSFRNTVLLIPRLPLAHDVPRTVQPFNGLASPITVGWLLDMTAQGRVPARHHVTARSRALATLRISVVLSVAGTSRCLPFRGAVTRELGSGRSFRFRGRGIEVGYLSGGSTLASVVYSTAARASEWQITNVGKALELRIKPSASLLPRPMICS